MLSRFRQEYWDKRTHFCVERPPEFIALFGQNVSAVVTKDNLHGAESVSNVHQQAKGLKLERGLGIKDDYDSHIPHRSA